MKMEIVTDDPDFSRMFDDIQEMSSHCPKCRTKDTLRAKVQFYRKAPGPMLASVHIFCTKKSCDFQGYKSFEHGQWQEAETTLPNEMMQ